MPHVHTEERFPDGDLAAVWDRLVGADPAASLFHRPRFLRRWCRHLRGDCDLRLRFIRSDDGDTIGVVPEVRERCDERRTVHFAGGEHVTDYLGPVSAPRHRDEVVSAWMDALVEEDDWDVLVAAGLAEDAGWAERIAKRATEDGFTVQGPERDGVCPQVDLSGGWDAYLDRLSGKQRHEIRRKARKLARESDRVELVDVDPEDLHPSIETFLALNRTLEDEKGRFFVDEAMADFFHALAREFGGDRTLRIHRLDVDGAPAAVTVSFVHPGEHGGIWGLYNSAFDRGMGALAPGMVLVGELTRLAAEEGCAVFDLLRGDEPYKYRFGARDRPLLRVTATRPGGEA